MPSPFSQSLGASKPTTPKTTKKKNESGNVESCEHKLTKSKDRTGEACGKPAIRWKRCKACLKKAIVKTQLVNNGIATLDEIEKLLNGGATTAVSPVNPINPLNPGFTPEVAPVPSNFNV